MGRQKPHGHRTARCLSCLVPPVRVLPGVSGCAERLHGDSDAFDRAIPECSIAYADQNGPDHDAPARAVRRGKMEA